MKTGFTLIELLVVVLIIGILSAVAMPQYEKAVEKSRAGQVLGVVRALGQAQQTYYMANGFYASTFDVLDIIPPGWSGSEQWYTGATDTRSNGDWSIQVLSDGSFSGVYAGRLKGPYAGGGFGFLQRAGDYSDNEIICMERVRTGVVFAGPQGGYCTKLFAAEFEGATGGTRSFKMK